MRYGIIAAGEGSRLASEGVVNPKPLVEIGGRALVDRLMNIFAENDAERIAIICNEQMMAVQHHLKATQEQGVGSRNVPLDVVVKSTPSSMHSFMELASLLDGAPFILTTVDTIFDPSEFSCYVKAFQEALAQGCEAFMGVTDYVDDEKPLWVGVDASQNITGFYDQNSGNDVYVSGGIYGFAPSVLATLKDCVSRGEFRMRNFQRALLRDGRRVKAFPFSCVMDIDHASDIQKAEHFLNTLFKAQ